MVPPFFLFFRVREMPLDLFSIKNYLRKLRKGLFLLTVVAVPVLDQ
jgi:hypothetical protein